MLKSILVMSCIRPCVQLFMGLALCIADKSLGRNGQQIGMLMYPDDLCSAVIDNYGYYCLCVCLTVCWCFHLLGLVRFGLGQRRAVVIIGRWLLPSLVDTGDICCHYWQHILVFRDFITLRWRHMDDNSVSSDRLVNHDCNMFVIFEFIRQYYVCAMASQITRNWTGSSTAFSCCEQRKTPLLTLWMEIRWWPVDSPHTKRQLCKEYHKSWRHHVVNFYILIRQDSHLTDAVKCRNLPRGSPDGTSGTNDVCA